MSPLSNVQNCLLRRIAPYMEEDAHISEQTAIIESAGEEPVPSSCRNLAHITQLHPILRGVQAYPFEDHCDGSFEKCPLFAVFYGGAMAGDYRQLGTITEAYQRWFFERWMPHISTRLDQSISMLRFPSENAAHEFLSRALLSLNDARELLDELKAMVVRLEKEVGKVRAEAKFFPEEAEEGWSGAIIDARGLIHDINNIMASYLSSISYATKRIYRQEGQLTKDLKAIERTMVLLMELRKADLSSLESIAKLVAAVNNSRARDRKIKLEVGKMPRVYFPPDVRSTLFRLINEWTNNAIKHADDKKQSKRIAIRGEIFDGFLRVHTMDNGKGFLDLRKAFDRLRRGENPRERPKSSEGEGRGLLTGLRLADRAGWKLYIASAKGIGTDAGIYIEEDQFAPEPGAKLSRSKPGFRSRPAIESRRFFLEGLEGMDNDPAQNLMDGCITAVCFDTSTVSRSFQLMGNTISTMHLVTSCLPKLF